MSRSVTLIVLLIVREGRESAFEDFEVEATRIMRRYGGRIERRLALSRGDDSEQPDEVHLVTFPSSRAFDDYRADPGVSALAELRDEVIRKTVVWRGVDARSLGE